MGLDMREDIELLKDERVLDPSPRRHRRAPRNIPYITSNVRIAMHTVIFRSTKPTN